MQINKKQVRARFMHSSGSYNHYATAQQQIVRQLMQKLTPYLDAPMPSVLEVGCGSGFLTYEFLRQVKPAHLTLNDLYPLHPSLEQLEKRKDISFIEGDAEKIVWIESFDIILSASTIQWFNAPQEFFEKCAHQLNENGILAFSTFNPDNLREIKSLTGIGLAYPSKEELIGMLSPYFEILCITEKPIILGFSTPLEVLKHLSKTGVNGITSFKWNKSKLHLFKEKYQSLFSIDKGVSLTYTPLYFIARKKKTKDI